MCGDTVRFPQWLKLSPQISLWGFLKSKVYIEELIEASTWEIQAIPSEMIRRVIDFSQFYEFIAKKGRHVDDMIFLFMLFFYSS